MDGYTAWKIHRAIRFHLLTLRYDVFEHVGATKNSEIDHYLAQNDRKVFEFIGKQFDSPKEAVQFFVANIAYSGGDNIRDFGESWDNYLRWKKNKESLTKVIHDEIEKIHVPSDIYDGNPPKLLTELLAKRILPETAVAINRVYPFIDTWMEKKYFGSGTIPCIVKKMDRWVTYNTDVIERCVKERYEHKD